MKVMVGVVLVGDDGVPLAGSEHEEVIITTREAEDNFLRAGAVFERVVPMVHQQVRDQLSEVGRELEAEKRERPG